MPYKSETQHKKIPLELDRRIKLTDDQREDIRNLYGSWLYSQNSIARLFWVHRKTIYNVVNPEKYQAQLDRYSKEKIFQKYYNSEIHKEAMRKTRRYRAWIEKNLTDEKK